MSYRRIFGVWLLLCGAMVTNGIFREAALVPTIKRAAADIVSAALGITIILAVTRHFLRRAQPDVHPGRVAALWLGVTIAFEFLFGHYIAKHSWRRLIQDYNLFAGRLWVLVLAAVAAAPYILFALGTGQ